MPYLPKYSQVAVKIEGIEGTAEVLALADAKIMARNPSPTYDLPFYRREAVAKEPGTFTGTSGGPQRQSFAMEIPMVGSGTAGTPPAYDAIFRAMGFSVANVPATSDTYTPVIHGESVTMARYVANSATTGFTEKIHGARASGNIVLPTGAPAVLNPTVEGLYNVPTEETLLVPVHDTTVPVAIMGGTFTMDGVALKYSEFTVNVENTLEIRTDPSSATGGFSIVIVDQVITASCDPEMEDVGTRDFFTEMTTHEEVALSVVIGSTAGNIITISAPKVQITSLAVEGDTFLRSTQELQFNRSSGNDALEIEFT